MGTLRSIDGRTSDGPNKDRPGKDRRNEPRTEVDIPIRVWGVDTHGDRFLQEARGRDISLSGALVTQLDCELRSGDVIGILYGGRKARFRVVWVRYSGTDRKIQAAVHRIEPDECPWQNLLEEEPAITTPMTSPPTP